MLWAVKRISNAARGSTTMAAWNEIDGSVNVAAELVRQMTDVTKEAGAIIGGVVLSPSLTASAPR